MNIAVTAIYLAIFSWHSTCGSGCNQNNNPVAGIDFIHNESRYTAIAFPNSHSKGSFLLAKREKYYFYGAVTGYHELPVPFIAPRVNLGPVDVSCLTDLNTAVCMAAFKWRF